jgi:hypothetical protein
MLKQGGTTETRRKIGPEIMETGKISKKSITPLFSRLSSVISSILRASAVPLNVVFAKPGFALVR